MLLRFYRLTDKLGMVILKLGAALTDWLLDSAVAIIAVSSHSIGVLISALIAILMAIIGLMWRAVKALGSLLQSLWRFSRGTLNTVAPQFKRVQTTAANRTSTAMARRAARDEIDVVMTEDPLKVQNRRLSFLVLLLGTAVLATVIWATNPNNTNIPLTIPNVNTGNVDDTQADDNNEVEAIVSAPTSIPTATPLPDALQAQGAIAYTAREQGQTDIWAVNVGSRNPIRITNDVADERDPEWNSDGTRLAYAARIDGNWDLYVYDALQDATSRVTVDLSFQANPTWSPDGAFLAYENYQNDNLDIYAVPINASSPPSAITNHPAPDFSPAWGPDGRRIAFVSWRDGNQDIYIISLEDLSITNVTNTPTINEDHPTWSPDGRSIAYSAREPGAVSETVYVQSLDDVTAPTQLIAVGRTPTFAPDGSSIAYVVDSADGQRTNIFAVTVGDGGVPILIASILPESTTPHWTLQPLPSTLVNAGGLPIAQTEPLYIEQTDTFDGTQYQLQSLGNVQVDPDQVFLSDAVNDSFNALRQATFEDVGRDYLSALDAAFWRLDRPADAGEPGRNWHRTGRAFAIQRNGIRGFPPPIEVVQEVRGNQVYWRVFVRVDDESQRGQLGEPLRTMPWNFLATETDVEAFNQGGRLRREVPNGYYVDFTQLAEDYGWSRAAAGSDWIANQRVRNYWLFINADNLTWCQAMLQLYTEGQLVNYECTG
ncbi:MAG: TolB family protein [Anaerolineae bacterium]